MAAYMRCNPTTGQCRCTQCGADVLWVKVTQTGKWAGIVTRDDAETIVSEPYNGGKRDICTKVQPGASLHGCRDIVEKYRNAFRRFTAGDPEPATRQPKAPEPPVVRCNQCGTALDPKGQCVNQMCALSHHEPPFPPTPAPTPEPKADPSDPLSGLKAWIESLAQNSMDREAVEAMIADALKGIEPKVVHDETIIVERANGSKAVLAGHHHPKFKVLLHLAMLRKHVFMPGPSGAGKSYVARQIAESLGLPYYEVLMGPADTPGKVLGFINASGEVVATEFRKAWIEGGIVHIDEIANGNPAALVVLNSALANGHCTFPDGQYEKHADFVCFASDNTWGTGPNAQFPTRRPMDGASRDRFAFVEVGYDEAFEDDVALSRAKGDVKLSERWTAWVRSVRLWAKDNAPSLLVTPRATYEGIDLLVNGVPAGLTPEEWIKMVADTVVFKTSDEDMVTRIVTACPLPKIEVKG